MVRVLTALSIYCKRSAGPYTANHTYILQLQRMYHLYYSNIIIKNNIWCTLLEISYLQHKSTPFQLPMGTLSRLMKLTMFFSVKLTSSMTSCTITYFQLPTHHERLATSFEYVFHCFCNAAFSPKMDTEFIPITYLFRLIDKWFVASIHILISDLKAFETLRACNSVNHMECATKGPRTKMLPVQEPKRLP